MVITLFALDGKLIGNAEISPFRAYPSHVIVSPREGGLRLFKRRGPSVGESADEYDEIKPVIAELQTNY